MVVGLRCFCIHIQYLLQFLFQFFRMSSGFRRLYHLQHGTREVNLMTLVIKSSYLCCELFLPVCQRSVLQKIQSSPQTRLGDKRAILQVAFESCWYIYSFLYILRFEVSQGVSFTTYTRCQ